MCIYISSYGLCVGAFIGSCGCSRPGYGIKRDSTSQPDDWSTEATSLNSRRDAWYASRIAFYVLPCKVL